MSHLPFSAYTVAMVTPFTESGTLDEAPVRRLVAHLVGQGVPALLVSGSTGEQHSMTVDERSRLYRWAVQAAGAIPVYAGVAAVRTSDAVELARAAAQAGVRGVMLGFPPYVRLTSSDALVYARAVCQVSDLPVLLYNNPLRTAFDLVLPTLEQMATENPTVRGVKETADLSRARGIKAALGASFQVFTGGDRTVIEAWNKGFDGLTSIAGNLWPREMAAVVAALEGNEPAKASQVLTPLVPALQAVVEPQLPASLKRGLGLRGIPGGWCREPLGHLDPVVIGAIEAALLLAP